MMNTATKQHQSLLKQEIFSAEMICNVFMQILKNSKYSSNLIIRDFFDAHAKMYGNYVEMASPCYGYNDGIHTYDVLPSDIMTRVDLRDVVEQYIIQQHKLSLHKFNVDCHEIAKIFPTPVLSFYCVDGEQFYVLNVNGQFEEYTDLNKISARLKADNVNSCIWDDGDSNLPPPKLDGITWEEEY